MSQLKPRPTFSSVEKSIEKAIAEGRLPGTAVTVLNRKGDVLFQCAQGTTNNADPQAPAMTTDTPTIFASAMKIATCTAALQLIEQSRMSLDDPVEKYIEEINNIKLLQGWNEDGSPKTLDAETVVTIRHLMTHTSGFAYDMFDDDACKWRLWKKDIPPGSISTGRSELYYDVAFVSEPGTKWVYGVNIDWLGFVIERVTGSTFREYIVQHVLEPMGMKHSPIVLGPDDPSLTWHIHMPDGSLVAHPEIRVGPNQPCMGGGGLHSSANDFAALLVTLLNGGTHPISGVQLLKPETAQQLFVDHLPEGIDRSYIGEFHNPEGLFPPQTAPHKVLPVIKKGWSLGWMLNNEDVPNGRKKGSGSWLGQGNVSYWVDPNVEGGRVAVFVTGLLPFLDPSALELMGELEAAVYGGEQAVSI